MQDGGTLSDRYCPYCGELVQSNAVTCPKCFKRLPPEPEVSESRTWHRQQRAEAAETVEKHTMHTREPRQRKGHDYNRRTAMFLNLIPGFFGIVGLGQIYRDYKSLTGYFLLLLGLVLFSSSIMLMMHWTPSYLVNIFSSLSAFPIMLIYALVYLFGLLDIALGKVFHMNRNY